MPSSPPVAMQLPPCALTQILEDAPLEEDAISLADCDAHCRLVARAGVDLVTSGASTQACARDLLSNLIGRNTYGSFAELAAYDWLMRCNVRIQNSRSQ